MQASAIISLHYAVALCVSTLLLVPGLVSAHAYTVTGPFWVADRVHTSTPLASGDFDGDGRDDLVSCFSGNRIVMLTQGTGSGLQRTFDAPIWTPFAPVPPNTNYPYLAYCLKIAVADISGDGRDDVVVTHTAGVTVLRAQATGGFLRQETSASEDDTSGRGKVSGDLIDVDGDGKLDLLVNRLYGGVGWLRNDGSGHLHDEVALPSLTVSGRIAVGDLNSDGLSDFATTGTRFELPGSPAFLDIYLNTGDSSFAPLPRQYLLPATYPQTLAIGDVSGDGRDDIVVTSSANWPKSLLYVFPQRASGIIDRYQTYPTVDIPASIVIADIDGDRRNDVVVNHRGWFTVTTHLQSAGSLLHQTPVYGFWNNNDDPQAIATGDFNSDGCRDVAISVTGQYHLLNGTGCQVADTLFVSGFGG